MSSVSARTALGWKKHLFKCSNYSISLQCSSNRCTSGINNADNKKVLAANLHQFRIILSIITAEKLSEKGMSHNEVSCRRIEGFTMIFFAIKSLPACVNGPDYCPAGAFTVVLFSFEHALQNNEVRGFPFSFCFSGAHEYTFIVTFGKDSVDADSYPNFIEIPG